MSTLYELSEQYKLLEDYQETVEGDFSIALRQIKDEIHVKADNYCKLMKNLEADANGLREEEERLSKKRKAIEGKIKSLKEHLEYGMRNAKLTDIKTDLFTIKIQNNPPSVNVINEDVIPKKYFLTTQTLIKKDILEDLKAGKSIKGVELQHTESLRIR